MECIGERLLKAELSIVCQLNMPDSKVIMVIRQNDQDCGSDTKIYWLMTQSKRFWLISHDLINYD